MEYVVSVLSIISLLAIVAVSAFLLWAGRKAQKRLDAIEEGVRVVAAAKVKEDKEDDERQTHRRY